MLMQFDFITIGSATHDIMYDINDGVLLPKFNKCGRQDSLAFTLGSKFEAQQVHFNYGGGASNVAVSLSKLGFEVGTIMAVFDYEFGQGLIKNLKKQKISSRLVQTIKKQHTGLSFIINSKQDRKYILFVNRAANQNLTFSAAKYKNLNTRWLYLNSLNFPGWQKISREIIKYKNTHPETKIHWNPGKWQIKAGVKKIGPLLRQTEVLQVNREEAMMIVEGDKRLKAQCKNMSSLIKAVASLGPKIVVITDGIKGAYCYDGKKLYKEKASNDKPVDTTGAGDSFGSGFVGGLNLFDGDIKKALKLAVMNSGSVVSVCGAQNGLMARKIVLRKIN